jgi:hypothetical protein
MKDNQSSLVFKLVLLYSALSIILGLGFGIDIAGWWAVPVYDGLSVVVNGITGLFH